jgi:hypothetical protein
MEIDLKKGQILVVKAPPLFEREYLYQVAASGNKVVRAHLYHCEKVKKHWSPEDFALLWEHGIVRLANEQDLLRLKKLEPAAQSNLENEEVAEDEFS